MHVVYVPKHVLGHKIVHLAQNNASPGNVGAPEGTYKGVSAGQEVTGGFHPKDGGAPAVAFLQERPVVAGDFEHELAVQRLQGVTEVRAVLVPDGVDATIIDVVRI